ncbi:LysR substrate-binding domain-containing protein, partial [Pseudomonas sp. NY11226]|uniref:LysR family transcriptional regulator n=1 Tax=Pseudomonas sp. NY11226 TaxID=3400362 RepID=UPI003A897236
RLFVRTTRQIGLTAAGQRYMEQCRSALSLLTEAEREVTGQQAEPAGKLRISLPTPYAHHRVLPLLGEFRQRYPQVHVDVHISNRNIDFAEEGYDLAVRGRLPPDSNLVARKLEDAELVLVASPGYLRRAGTPQTLEDLRQHDCIQFELPSTGRNIPWIFMQGGRQIDVPTSGGTSCSGDVLGGLSLARHGAGLFQAYRFTVQDDLRRGDLVEVLPQFGGATRSFTLLYPHVRHVSLRVRTFVDFLLERLRR